jgi:hypothetical protein
VERKQVEGKSLFDSCFAGSCWGDSESSLSYT